VSSTAPLSVVFAGFRATGKTTFLVALWHTVVNNDVPGALSLERMYEGDRDYITERYNEWLAYEAVKRTQVDYDTPILMTLREQQQNRLLQLGIPDLSGETFKVQFEERRASPILVDAIRGATGVALFVNPKEVDDPTRIRDVWDAVDDDEPPGDEDGQEPAHPLGQDRRPIAEPTGRAAREVAEPEDGGELAAPLEANPSRGPAAHFNASRCCSQVKYVDLLQQLVEHGPSKPLRCAVIVSAMDTLDDTEFKDRPEHFLRDRMSMLDQYLRANRPLYEARIYGVSAQGGKYDTATIEALAKLGPHRIRVCTDGQRDNDISRPIRWLAFGEE
jgi:hypothetical protein